MAIKLVEPVRLHTGAVYIIEKAVYMNNGKNENILQYYKLLCIMFIFNTFIL